MQHIYVVGARCCHILTADIIKWTKKRLCSRMGNYSPAHKSDGNTNP